jgi:putative effector of murein hydrolase
MKQEFFQLWVYLSASPLFGLTATLAAYSMGLAVARRFRFHPAVNPVVIAVAILVIVLQLTGLEYPRYFDGAQFVHFMLGPATVALAVPIFAHLPTLKRYRWSLLVALLAGGAASALSAVGIAMALGASGQTIMSLLPKSVTAPIAMGISEQIGGTPALTAVYCISTGVLGAILAQYVFCAARIRSWLIQGFTLGIAAHGIGTARAFQQNV